MLDDLDTDCSACGRKVRYTPGHSVALKDEGGGAAKADKAARALDKSLSQLSRTINFRL